MWRQPSAAYPLLINTPALTDWSFSPSFLIISGRLYQGNRLISSPKHTFISQHPPPFSAAGRSGVYLNPLLSEHWRGGEAMVERQSTDHNGWPIINGKRGWGAGRRGRLWGEWINTPSQFLMRGRIGLSQADGNPALPGVVDPHCLSAGHQVFGGSLGNSAPSGDHLPLHQIEFSHNIYICGIFFIL